MFSYEFIGRLVVFALIAVLALLLIALPPMYLISRKKGMFLPSLVLFVVDSLNLPAKKFVSMLGGNPEMVDRVGIEIRNMMFRDKFRKIPYGERLIILPQCLRHVDCPAKISPVEGIKCLKCGRCKIAKIAEKATVLGYKGFYIVPGGSFAARVVKRIKPKAVFGVACPHELNWAMLESSDRAIPPQGIILLRTGCVNTDVDLEEVLEQIE